MSRVCRTSTHSVALVASTVLLGLSMTLAPAGRNSFEAYAFGVLVGISGASVAFALARWPGNEGRGFFTLGSFFCIYFGIIYGWSTLGSKNQIAARALPGSLEAVELSLIPTALLGWTIGYLLTRPSRVVAPLSRLVIPSDHVRPSQRLLIVYASTVIVRLYLLRGSGFGFLQNVESKTTSVSISGQYLEAFGSFGVLIVGVALIAGRTSGIVASKYRTLAWLGLFTELAFGALTGQKSQFLFVVLLLGVVATMHGIVRPNHLAIAALVAIFIIFPINETYRELLRPAVGEQARASDAPGLLVYAVTSTAGDLVTNPGDALAGSFDSASQRLSEADRAAVSVHAHDTRGLAFESPTDVAVRIAGSLVPRLLWPGKPIDLYGLEVTRNYYGTSERVLSSGSLSPAGDSYRYGGLPSVFVAFILLGILTRLFDQMFDYRRNPYLVVLLVAAIPFLRKGDMASIVAGALRYYLMLAIVMRLVFFVASVTSSATETLKTGSSTS